MTKQRAKLENSLHDIQTVKQQLQQKLNEKKIQRQNLEAELHGITSKVGQTKDLHTKMSETCKLAQHKVIQSQAQVDSLEMNNAQKREKLKELSGQSEHEDNLRTEYIHDLQEKISEMTATFLKAIKCTYTDSGLRQKTADTMLCEKKKAIDDSKLEKELQECESYWNKVKAANPTNLDHCDIDRQLVMDVFREDHEEILSSARTLCEQSKAVCEQV